MIIVKLMGGLGNQMFQYAAARRLAWSCAAEMKLDLSFLQGDQAGTTRRVFELKHLSISAREASAREIADASGEGEAPQSVAIRMFRRFFSPGPRPKLYRERFFHFDARVLKLRDNCFLDGYWQSEKYFVEIEQLIRQEFTVAEPLSGMNLELARAIQAKNSICVHVRRGDYVSSPMVNQFHGTCPLEYYLQAVAKMASLVPEPHFFIFSDEAGWVKENLSLPYPSTVVAHNGALEGYQDLRLMSLCRHHIIANSSLSWWGAWLCTNPGKTVIAPRRWFSDPSIDTGDLIPAGWLRL